MITDLPRVTINTGKKYTIAELIRLLFFLSVILYFGRTLFIPLAFAMLISFILYPICKWLEKKGVNEFIAIMISISGLFILVVAIAFLFLLQLKGFLGEWQNLKNKLYLTYENFSSFLLIQFNISRDQQEKIIRGIADHTASQVIPFLQSVIISASVSLVLLILVPLFSVLILHYRKMLVHVVYSIFSGVPKETISEIIIETAHSYYNFIKGMLLVYLTVGTLNSIGLALIGVPHPILFGFIASVLTFIPYVGIIIASLLPITISWLTFNSIWYPIGVIGVFAFVQLLEAYLIFPLAVSKKLHINTLVIMVMIIAGGILWGAAGMILFIPFISIIKLIADRTTSLTTLSRVLS